MRMRLIWLSQFLGIWDMLLLKDHWIKRRYEMKFILATLWGESLKIRRSRMFWATVLFFILVSSMMSLLMFVQKYPEVPQIFISINNTPI